MIFDRDTDTMREFTDPDGRSWIATVREEPGPDYKGRYYFVMTPAGGSSETELALTDVRWNTERTARRTLETMSEFELLRKLRSARGRTQATLPA